MTKFLLHQTDQNRLSHVRPQEVYFLVSTLSLNSVKLKGVSSRFYNKTYKDKWCINIITSEAEGRASSTENKGKSWVWATGRPAVVTLLRGLYLWNRKPDWQAVFFGGYPHPFYRVWDQCRIMPVLTVARGACYLGGCHKCSACCFSVTTRPIALKFGMHLGTH